MPTPVVFVSQVIVIYEAILHVLLRVKGPWPFMAMRHVHDSWATGMPLKSAPSIHMTL